MQHFTIKPGKRLSEQAELGHNRWHPDIPFLSKVKPGEEIIIETLDFLDAQILDNDDCSDVRDVDLTRAHPLTGPFYVEGAEPGDLLVMGFERFVCNVAPYSRRAYRWSDPSRSDGLPAIA